MATSTNAPKFDLDAELARIDRRRAERQAEEDRAPSVSDQLRLWIPVAFVLPITVGVILGFAF